MRSNYEAGRALFLGFALGLADAGAFFADAGFFAAGDFLGAGDFFGVLAFAVALGVFGLAAAAAFLGVALLLAFLSTGFLLVLNRLLSVEKTPIAGTCVTFERRTSTTNGRRGALI